MISLTLPSIPASLTASVAAFAQNAPPAQAPQVTGGPAWVVAANLVIWTGLFLYLLRIERRLDGDVRDPENGGTR